MKSQLSGIIEKRSERGMYLKHDLPEWTKWFLQCETLKYILIFARRHLEAPYPTGILFQ